MALVRWFLRIFGALATAGGLGGLVYARSTHGVAATTLLLVGIVCFVLSFNRRRSIPAAAARDVVEVDPLP